MAELILKNQSHSVITATPRFVVLDAHRGLIMILMAVDHASYFIARAHSAEFWGVALPVYPDAFWFWTRWITHLCAPGFFLLMGIGMILFADSRSKAGWNQTRMTKFFVIRGFSLILLQLFVEAPAWMVGDLFLTPGAMTFRGGVPGAGSGGIIYLGVLFSLGGAMVFWAFMRRASSPLIAVISLVAILATQFVTPGQDHAASPYSPVLRILFIPGYSNGLTVFYPIVPWLGVTGLGLLFGRSLIGKRLRIGRLASWAALGCLILFLVVRSSGTFGNLNEVPAGWMGFLNVVKYPPSLSFLTVTLAVNFLWIAIWKRLETQLQSPFHVVLVFGRAPLFFYLLHLWLFALLGFLFRGGSSLAVMYFMWLVALAILYPLCYRFFRFKNRKPVTSLWRFL